MTIEKFRDLLHATPFVPFIIHLADGRSIPVAHPDFVAASQTGRILCVFHDPNDASTFVDTMLVRALELNPGSASTAAH